MISSLNIGKLHAEQLLEDLKKFRESRLFMYFSQELSNQINQTAKDSAINSDERIGRIGAFLDFQGLMSRDLEKRLSGILKMGVVPVDKQAEAAKRKEDFDNKMAEL